MTTNKSQNETYVNFFSSKIGFWALLMNFLGFACNCVVDPFDPYEDNTIPWITLQVPNYGVHF